MSVDASVETALEALRRGEVIGLPTDTVYGIAAVPFSAEAVSRLFEVKARPAVKPIPILAADIAEVRRVAMLDDRALEVARRHWPGALTLVLNRAERLPSWVGDWGAGTIGVRVPANDTALAVLGRAGPLAVTSANRSGEPPATDDVAARAALGEAVAVYVRGRSGGGSPSTVVDLTGTAPRVLRHGPVSWSTP